MNIHFLEFLENIDKLMETLFCFSSFTRYSKKKSPISGLEHAYPTYGRVCYSIQLF